ncbi:MAG: hypothetical protein E6590_18145, partial [Clostridiales bacterium]|nr:hypothetical protein [Clostridiales bacterium]
HITAAERTLWNTVSNKVDKVTGKGLSTEDYTTAEKSKLSGIEVNANRYVHPSDANTRHVTDTEKATWNGKANASHGNHVPATQTANNKKFLRCDNTWQDVTPGNIGAAALEHDHDSRYYTESEANAKFVSKEDLGAAGYGDMTKAVYDKNGNGSVDKAEAVPWTGVTGKPSTFPPSSHNHDGSYATKKLRASHYTRFTVAGEANKYYPVIIRLGGAAFGACHLSISRGYNWTAPDSWNTATHRGGLTLGILWNGDTYWGGNSGSSYVVTMFDESYTTMVAGLSYCTSGLVVWLRGGGAQYQIESDYGIATTVEVKLTDFTDSANRVFPVRSNTNSVEVEVRAKFTNRSGALYDQGARVYSPKNKPTAADVGALPKKGLTWNDLKGV